MSNVQRLPETFEVRFGILNPSIAKQIKAQKLKYDRGAVDKFEIIRYAIHRLAFNGMLADSQIDKLFMKLYNKILRHVGKENNCNVRPLK